MTIATNKAPSFELLSQALDTNTTGSLILDPHLNVIFWNRWFETSSLINRNEILNKYLFSLFPKLENTRIHKAIESCVTKGNASFISHAFNKTPFPLFNGGDKNKPIAQLTYIKPLFLEDGHRYCFIQITDASTSVFREKQLRKIAKEAEELSKLKSGFVSSVSHELRTPLTSIMGALGLLKAGAVVPSSDSYSTMIDIAYNNADRLLLLISDILDIEKIESGKMKFNFAETNINELIESCIKQNSGLAEKYLVNFEFNKDENIPLVLIDKNRIFQVLNNLMSNAAKFEPHNGIIKIKSSVEVGDVRISITDHGAGIPCEFKSRIFQAFSQADVSNTKGVGGTGLGLAISKTIIEQHKGEINFDSIQNKSTCFYFTLPIKP